MRKFILALTLTAVALGTMQSCRYRPRHHNSHNATRNTRTETTTRATRGHSDRVKFRREGGVLFIPVEINGFPMDFIFDTGASSVSMSLTEAIFMYKQGRLTDDDILWDMSKRALHSAWKAGCILWVLNNQSFSKSIAETVEWLVYRDIWSKMQIFADMLGKDADLVTEAQRRGPKNMLDGLPDKFNEAQLKALRVQLGKNEEGANAQLRQWLFRKFITYSNQTGLYIKTDEYLGVKSEE